MKTHWVLVFVDFVFTVSNVGNFPVKALKACVLLLTVKTGTAKVFTFNRIVGPGKDFIA
jgi:hypothetical protein